MDNKMLSEALISMLGAGNVRISEPMKPHTTFRIGGAADYYVTPQTEKQIADVITFLKKSDISYIVIGNGSNILVSLVSFIPAFALTSTSSESACIPGSIS